MPFIFSAKSVNRTEKIFPTVFQEPRVVSALAAQAVETGSTDELNE